MLSSTATAAHAARWLVRQGAVEVRSQRVGIEVLLPQPRSEFGDAGGGVLPTGSSPAAAADRAYPRDTPSRALSGVVRSSCSAHAEQPAPPRATSSTRSRVSATQRVRRYHFEHDSCLK